MDKDEILREAKGNLDDYDIKDFEQLKSAIESKKIHLDIEGSRFQRLTTFITSLTALITVVILIWQSGGASQKNHSDILDKHIATIKTDIDNKKSELESIQTSLTSATLKKEKAITDYDSLKKEIQKLQNEQIDLKLKLDEKNARVGVLTTELNSLGNQIDSRKDDDALKKANERLHSKISEQNRQINDLSTHIENKDKAINKLIINKTKVGKIVSQFKPYESMLEGLGIANPPIEILNHKRNDPKELTFNLKDTSKSTLVFNMLNTGNIKKNMDISIKVSGGEQMRYVNLKEGSYTLLRPDTSKEISLIIYVEKVNEPSRNLSDEEATYTVYFIGKKILTTY
jgi:hypothetical protein